MDESISEICMDTAVREYEESVESCITARNAVEACRCSNETLSQTAKKHCKEKTSLQFNVVDDTTAQLPPHSIFPRPKRE